MTLVLGSSSSARVQLLKNLGLDFEIRKPTFDERSYPFKGDPKEYCQSLSKLKNESLFKSPSEIVITCDTIVYFENQVFNKPSNYDEAFQMLKQLSGNTHQVFSGITCAHNQDLITDYEQTLVTFHDLSDDQIELFLQDPNYLHRSGSYTTTGKGALLIKTITGSVENVIGLPFNTLETILNQWDRSLWDQFGSVSY